MIIITSTSTDLRFSDGGDFSLDVPKDKVSMSLKKDYIIFSFGSGVSPQSLKYHYTDVDVPSAASAIDLRDLITEMLSSNDSQPFVAEAGQTVFTVTDFTATASSKVFVNGALTTSGWTRSGQDFIFTAAPGVGAVIVIIQ